MMTLISTLKVFIYERKKEFRAENHITMFSTLRAYRNAFIPLSLLLLMSIEIQVKPIDSSAAHRFKCNEKLLNTQMIQCIDYESV